MQTYCTGYRRSDGRLFEGPLRVRARGSELVQKMTPLALHNTACVFWTSH